MEQSKKEQIIEELNDVKKKIVIWYSIFFIILVACAFLSLIYSKWFIVPFSICIIGFIRESLQLDNVNRDLDVIKRSR